MLDVFADKNSFLVVSLERDDDFIKLSEIKDSVRYSIMDASGNIVAGLEDMEYEVEGDSLSTLKIPLPVEANTIEEGSEYNIRFVVINYTYQKSYYTIRESYRVIKFSPYTVSVDDVRNLFGLPPSVIEDSMVDIYGSYINLKSSVGDSLDTALKSFGTDSLKANRAIALKAAISLESAIPLLVPKIETDSVVSQTKYTFTLDDLKNLLQDMKDELEDILEELESGEVTATGSIPFVIGDYEDIFTGES